MKSSHPHLRGTAVAAAVAVMFTTPAYSAPQKTAPVPVPVVEQTVPEKKGMFGKLKSALSFKKNAEAPAPETKPAEKSKPAAKVKVAAARDAKPAVNPVAQGTVARQEKAVPVVKGKMAPKPAAPKFVAVEETLVPAKKGLFKKLFGKPAEEPAAEPQLARARTAKPAPVKEVKPEAKLAQESVGEPQKKRGFLGFLRGDGSKSRNGAGSSEIPEAARIVRPDDWEEHRVVQEDEMALYSFGPSQAQGPDERLSRGTLVKVKKVTKGWALVEVLGGISGYMDASVLRAAEKQDFADPPAPVAATAVASLNLKAWAPAPPPPDLPDQPGAMDNSGALLLLPPLELEPKP